MPFTMVPIACSRTPKCIVRPPGDRASRLPALLSSKLVLVDGARSPAPPISHGNFAASGGSILLGRRAIADHAVDDNKCRLSLVGAEVLQAPRDAHGVIGVADVHHVPAIAAKALFDILAEGEIGVAFDGHRVAVVDPAQV